MNTESYWVISYTHSFNLKYLKEAKVAQIPISSLILPWELAQAWGDEIFDAGGPN